jgi:MerR family regulatory protein
VTTWSIGEAAAKCGLSQHTLRWYERIGHYASCLAEAAPKTTEL